MPKLQDVKLLLKAAAERNNNRMQAVLTSMIANEQANGRIKAAEDLTKCLSYFVRDVQLEAMPQDLKKFCHTTFKTFKYEDLILSESVCKSMREFFDEYEKKDLLIEHGLTFNNKILLSGEPGNGKTSLAAAIANKLNLPFVSINISQLVDSHLGSSSRNLTTIFNALLSHDCVCLLDEFDTIGRHRSRTESQHREYSAIVNGIIVNLDYLSPSSIIIAATNMEDTIDKAILRRFDLKLTLDKPSSTEIELYLEKYMIEKSIEFNKEEAMNSLVNESWHAVEEYCIKKHKAIVLGRETK